MQTDTTAATSGWTNYSQALLKLFTLTRRGCLPWDCQELHVSTRDESDEATGWTGAGKGKQAGFVWRKIRQVLTACRLSVIADQAAIWFCDQFSIETNDSSQPEDGLSATITGSQDKLTTSPWCPEAAFPLYHKMWPTVQIIKERGSDSRAADRHRCVYVHMHACSGIQRRWATDRDVGWQT